MTGALHHVADARKNDADEDTNDEVMHAHDEDNGQDGQVFELVTFAKGVPESFLHEVDTQEEDECADEADRDVADHGRACNPDGGCCECEHDTCSSAVAAVVDEHDAVGVDEVILGLC